MIVLGIARSVHDPSAALVIDGRPVAGAEEERFCRVKHAAGRTPLAAARFCLDAAGVEGSDVDRVAFPWSLETYRAHRWIFARRHLSLPRSAWRAVSRTQARWTREIGRLHDLLDTLGVDRDRVAVDFVPHHVAHAASAFHVSAMEDAAILTLDAMGEFDTMLLAEGSIHGIRPLARRYMPDSPGTFYTAFTEYLGLRPNDGEYRLMGMAPYGDPDAVDLAPMVTGRGRHFRVDPRHVFPPRSRCGTGRFYSKAFEERFGPPRKGDGLGEPYVHIAAAVQR